MIPSLLITWEKVHENRAVIAHVERRFGAMQRVFDRIVSCRVLIAAEHHNPRNGHRYRARIDLALGDETLVVGGDSVEERVFPEIRASVDAVFDAADMAVRAWLRRQSGEPRRQDAPMTAGVVRKMFRYEGFGVLEGVGGVALRFHRNAVLRGAFEHLEVGDAVRYLDEGAGEERQATCVDAGLAKSRA